MADLGICNIPSIFLLPVLFILNISMFVCILKKNRIRQNVYLLLGINGLSNIFFIIQLIGDSALKRYTSERSRHVDLFMKSLVAASALFHLSLNIIIAYDRYFVTNFPLKYKTTNPSERLKKLLAFVLFASILLGFALAYPAAYFKYMRIIHIFIGILRVITCILLAFFYYKIYEKVKSSRVNALGNSNESAMMAAHALRRRSEKYLMKMCIGITVSYLILNLPMAIALCIFETTNDCKILNGRVFTASAYILMLNLTFDPLWYFYTEKRKNAITQL